MKPTRLFLAFVLVAVVLVSIGGASTVPLTREGGADASAPPHASKILAELDEGQRSNAIIGLEATSRHPGVGLLEKENKAVALWNRGNHDQAIHLFQDLESNGSYFVPGITWKHPIVSETKRAYQDVRIGNPRTNAKSVDLDFHRSTGNLYAAVAWGTGWSMNISTDGGATWQETYFYPVESVISMQVCGEFVWVSYSSSGVPSELRMRRFFTENGANDSVYHFKVVDDISPATIVDVAMTSNADVGDTGVYYACIASDNAAYFYWNDLIGTTFNPFHPPVVNADSNLDITLNPGAGSGFFLFISFESLGGIQVWRLHLFGGWDHVLGYAITGDNPYTAISANQDTVMAVHESNYTHGDGILQHMNYNAGQGSDWLAQVIYSPDSASAPDAAGADVSMRSPRGSIVTYQLEEGAFDRVFYVQLDGHGQGVWGAPVPFNEIDPASQEQTTVEWLGARCVSSYGMVYLSNGEFVPYFDLVTRRGFFCDGFESEDTSAWN